MGGFKSVIRAADVDLLRAAVMRSPSGVDSGLTDEGSLPMPGHFELVDAEPHGIRVLLVSATGETLATSKTYGDTPAAAAAVVAIREHAATAHIIDRTTRPDPIKPTR